MNGVLADIPNSNRNIEIQILNKIIQQFCFNCYTDPLTPMDETFMSKALIELTSVDRNISTKYNELKHLKELTQIREDMFEYYRAIDRGDFIDWPIELLHPSKIKVKVDDSFYQEITLFCTNLFNDEVHVFPRIDKFGRCWVNGQLFSSDYNSTDRGALIQAMFVMNDSNELHPYFGIVI